MAKGKNEPSWEGRIKRGSIVISGADSIVSDLKGDFMDEEMTHQKMVTRAKKELADKKMKIMV